MCLIVMSVDNGDVAGGKQRRDWSLIINVNNMINNVTSEGTRNFPLWLSNYIIYEDPLFML